MDKLPPASTSSFHFTCFSVILNAAQQSLTPLKMQLMFAYEIKKKEDQVLKGENYCFLCSNFQISNPFRIWDKEGNRYFRFPISITWCSREFSFRFFHNLCRHVQTNLQASVKRPKIFEASSSWRHPRTSWKLKSVLDRTG